MALLFSTEPSIAATGTSRRSPNVTRVPLSSTGASPPPYISQRSEFKRIATETLTVLKTGSYTVQTVRGDIDYDLRRKIREMRQRTRFYHPNDPKIMRWAASLAATPPPPPPPPHSSEGSSALGGGSRSFLYDDDGDGQRGHGAPVYISVFPGTTIEAVRSLMESDDDPQGAVGQIGVLSSGCATHPGGNLRGGSNGQELSLARASTLYASLITDEAKKLYDLKSLPTTNAKRTTSNIPGTDPVLNTHGMIYTPGVTVFRDDVGQYISPVDINILTCAAVPAQTVRAKYGPTASNSNSTASSSSRNAQTAQTLDARQVEALIQRTMRERMARILFLFARCGVRSLVLPAFGTGAFANSPTVVARLWAGLLTAPDAPFARVFDRVVFAVLPGPACDEFERVFGCEASSAQDQQNHDSASTDDSQRSITIVPTKRSQDNAETERRNLEQYARALGTSLRGSPLDVPGASDEGSSQTGKGKGKYRATCEDVDEDEED
ncbi:hypothetical protein D9619_011826 [Psilocybe cf. subviscida]|uniref:Microbial-type PARG catalytic domain-containing protein n=1 Tax=Psilocybe cf. subviscida TaxID=2480587 RepID=A0A8H5B051_9AGAR|nr:hypothetical protein D9619_011826 [Psilocybe cf. subviscida]